MTSKLTNLQAIRQLKNSINKTKYTDLRTKQYSLIYFEAHKNRYLNDFEIIDKYYNEGEILEVGSIPCHVTYCLQELGYPIIGIDHDPSRFKEYIKRYKLEIKKNDIEKDRLSFNANKFNLVLFNEVFEHMRIDPIKTLKEINRVMKKDGVLILTTPNLYSLHKVIMFNLGYSINDAYEEFNRLHTLGHVGHIREYSTREVKKFLVNTGFKIVNVHYKTYRYFHNDNEHFQSTLGKLGAYLLDLCNFVLPKTRTYQVVIARKI